jgi:ribose transport system substrate-binding protein
MRRFGAVLLLAMLTLVGCGKSDGAESKPADGRKLIGVSLRTRGRDFDKEFEEGLVGEAERRGFRLVVQSAEADPTAQARQLDDFVKQKVDAIVLVPCDADTAAASLRGAVLAKIPVFTAETAAKGADVVTHVASDDYLGGRLAGQTMARLLDGRGEVVVIDHPGAASARDRVRGFEDAIKPRAEMKIVDKPPSDGDRFNAQTVAEEALSHFPELCGVFCVDDQSALGALSAIESAGCKGVVVIGCDATRETQDAIRRGSALRAYVVQYPKRIGEKTIDVVATYFAGEKIGKLTPVNVGIVDAGNVGKPK